MYTFHSEKEKQLHVILEIFDELAERLLIKVRKEKKGVYKFFHYQTDAEKIAVALRELVYKTQFYIFYPHLSFSDENNFLEKINDIYKRLLQCMMNVLFPDFFSGFYANLKLVTDLLVKHDCDLKYLDCYLSYRRVGLM